MAADFEVCKARLEELVSWASEHEAGSKRNESATRLHLIDTLLFECLGWQKADCSPEDALDAGFADYVLSCPGPTFVVEAKREGIYFELPVGLRKRIVSLRTLRDNPAIDSAIRQALSYSHQRGLPLCAVANGHQLIILLASRQDGKPPLDGKAMVFESLEEMLAEFRTLWDAVSKPAVERLALLRVLQGQTDGPLVPSKLADSIPEYPGYRRRNELQADLQILGDVFIEGLTRSVEERRAFLERCYSPSGALSQYAMLSKDILRSRFSKHQETQLGVSAEAATTKKGLKEDVLASALSQKPIVLLGDVGVGKSTFIQNLIHVEARDIFDEAVVLTVDFGSQPALTDDLNGYVVRHFEASLRNEYDIDVSSNKFVRGVYHFELQRFADGIYAPLRDSDPDAYQSKELTFLESKLSDSAAHLKASLEHLHNARKKQIVVFLDNVDQREFDFQERVFLIAQSLAAEWPVAVFVALRPDTFYRSQASGSLAAYQPRVFSITPPRIDIVVRKRLEYGIWAAARASQGDLFGTGVGVSSRRLTLYLEALVMSFRRTSGDLNELVDNLSGGNVRRALSFVSTFIGSGHVNTKKILHIMERSGRYTVAHHEFLRAIAYGDYEFYDPSRSPVVNVFDVDGGRPLDHFLVPIAVTLLQRLGAPGAGEGYADTTRVFQDLQRIGYESVEVGQALRRCRKVGLIEGVGFETDDVPAKLRPTSIGTYTVRRLTGSFAYVDAVVVDTPVFDRAVRDHITDVKTIDERLERAQAFRAYLDSEWAELKDLDLPWSWAESSRRLLTDIERIASR